MFAFKLFALYSAILVHYGVQACQFPETNGFSHSTRSIASAINELDTYRNRRRDQCTPMRKIAINNVRVFDGHKLQPLQTVVIKGNIIGTDAEGAEQFDGEGGFLLPGLIDTHAHPGNITELQELSRFGVTTAMSPACFVPQLCNSLRQQIGLVDVLIGSLPAAASGSAHGNIIVMVDGNGDRLVSNHSVASQWLDEQINWGPDFIKLVAEAPGMDQETLDILTHMSHKKDKRVICHASAHDAYEQAISAQVDDIHHTPLDIAVTPDMVERIIHNKQITTPTLSMMKAISDAAPTRNYSAAQETVRMLREAAVPILAGTDANMQPGVPATVPFGRSIHQELELLVSAGLSPIEALQAVTSNPARHWGLEDRGVIAPGKRADLILVTSDPTQDIRATRDIKKVWLAGAEYSEPLGEY